MFGKSAFENHTEEELNEVKKKMAKAKVGTNNNMSGLVNVVDTRDNNTKRVTKENYSNNNYYFTPNSKVYQKLKKEGKIIFNNTKKSRRKSYN